MRFKKNVIIFIFIRPSSFYHFNYSALAFLSPFHSSLIRPGLPQFPSLQISVSLFVSLSSLLLMHDFPFCSNYVARQYEASTNGFFTWRVSKNTFDILCSVGFAIYDPYTWLEHFLVSSSFVRIFLQVIFLNVSAFFV